MNADLFTLLLTMGLVTGPALAEASTPVPQEARAYSSVTAMEKRLGNSKFRFCYRSEIEAGSPRECAKFQTVLKSNPFEMIVFPAK